MKTNKIEKMNRFTESFSNEILKLEFCYAELQCE